MATTYTLLSSVTVGSGGAANIEFTSIPATYTDLLVKFSVRASGASVPENIYITFNSSASGYSERLLYGTGSAVVSDNFSGAFSKFNYSNANSATSNTFSNSEFYIPNYAGSNYKSVSSDSSVENNATTGALALNAVLWSNTAAITIVKIAPAAGTFLQHSTAYLYGISNA